MSVNRWKMILMPVVTLGLASPMLVNCGALGDLSAAAGLPDVNCAGMETGDFSKLKIEGGAKVEGSVKGFLEAAYSLDKILVDMEVDLIASCGMLGKDLGMSEAELKAEPSGGEGGKKVCGAVAAKISGMLKANADAKLSLEIGEPKCYANVDVMMKCFGDCGSPIQGGKLEASCQGGEISGKCEGECKGGCTVEAGAECKGTCSAQCTGKCEAGFSGTCGGKCDGKCDGKNTKGECKGKCEGKCDAEAKGECTGTCDGSCSASCEVKGAAKCDGSCSGGCSVEIKAPECSGDFVPPSVDPSCQLSCGAKGLASARCEPPSVKIKVSGKAGADIEKLVAALQVSLPAILKIQLGTAKKLGATATALAKGAVEVKDVALSAGMSAGVCITQAIAISAQASLSIDVNIEASASVGGSVGTE